MVPQWLSESARPSDASRRYSIESTANKLQDPPPLNPEGRVGTSGKGLLPALGANHACVVVLTRASVPEEEEVLILQGLHIPSQLPWVGPLLA